MSGLGCGGVEWVWGLDQCVEGWGGVMSGYIPVHPVFNPVVAFQYLLPTVYLVVADIANPDLLACCCHTWICFDITRFYEKQCQLVLNCELGPHCWGKGVSKTLSVDLHNSQKLHGFSIS